MQRPKTMEEVMAEAFSKTENDASVEHNTTVDNASVEHSARVEDSTTVVQTSVEHKEELVLTNSLNQKQLIEETTVAPNATMAATTVAIKAEEQELSNKFFPVSDSKDFTDTLEFTLTSVAQPTVAPKAIVTEKTNTPTIEQTTVVHSATVAEKAIKPSAIPSRLKADITFLSKMIVVEWQTLSDSEINSSNYLSAYVEAWHWIEDEILPHLDKDSKLTLRRCYRKAFADREAKGKFFAGQTSLAQEVGLSKRRIQDILEIFNLLGWVRKIAHHNRGGYKGTDYEMCLPLPVVKFFK